MSADEAMLSAWCSVIAGLCQLDLDSPARRDLVNAREVLREGLTALGWSRSGNLFGPREWSREGSGLVWVEAGQGHRSSGNG